MDGIQLSRGYRATKNRQFTFNNLVLREVHGTHFIDLDRLKRWVDLRATPWFWTYDPWIGNPAPCPPGSYSLTCSALLTPYSLWQNVVKLHRC